nr:hypothetical protein [Nocardia pneumoniae]
MTELERLVVIDHHPPDPVTLEKGPVEAVGVLDFPTAGTPLEDGVHGRYAGIIHDNVGCWIPADIVCASSA